MKPHFANDVTVSNEGIMSKTYGLLLLLSSLMSPTMAIAEPHHHDGGHSHSKYHSGSHWGHSNWSYVVPTHAHYGRHHRGTYYVAGSNYFYTPTAVSYTTAMTVAPPPQAPVQMRFGGFGHCEDLAGRLETDVNQFCLDLHYNYQHNPGFRETYAEAYQMLQAVKYVHAKEHQGDRAEIARQVQSIDSLFHHVQEEVAGLNRHQHRQVGNGDAVMKTQTIEALLHHLAYDVGVEPHSVEEEQAPPPGGGPGGFAPPPPGVPGRTRTLPPVILP